MSKKTYDEVSVIRSLSKNSDIRINNTTIEVVSNSTKVGNGSWGKIDYLCKVCHYSYYFVTKLSGKARITMDEEGNPISRKAAKEKLNLICYETCS